MSEMEQGARAPQEAGGDAKWVTVVDGYNFLYRSHHALASQGRVFSAPDGTPTGGLLGFLNTLAKLEKSFPSAARAIAMDPPGGGSFRKEAHADYKANRPPTPDAIKVQLRLLREICPLLGWPIIETPGFEADDMLCAVAARARAEGWRCVIASGDKDMAQMVDGEWIWLFDPASKEAKEGKLCGPEQVRAKFGVEPGQVRDYLALMGDAIDSIPGLEGIGKKTAAKLLGEHGSIEAILGNLGALPAAARKRFEEGREVLLLSRELATPRLDMPIPMTLEQMEQAALGAPLELAREPLSKLGLKSALERVEKAIAKAQKAAAKGKGPRP